LYNCNLIRPILLNLYVQNLTIVSYVLYILYAKFGLSLSEISLQTKVHSYITINMKKLQQNIKKNAYTFQLNTTKCKAWKFICNRSIFLRWFSLFSITGDIKNMTVAILM